MRLNQLARKLQVTPDRILNELKKQGYYLDYSPNLKIEDNLVDELEKVFLESDETTPDIYLTNKSLKKEEPNLVEKTVSEDKPLDNEIRSKENESQEPEVINVPEDQFCNIPVSETTKTVVEKEEEQHNTQIEIGITETNTLKERSTEEVDRLEDHAIENNPDYNVVNLIEENIEIEDHSKVDTKEKSDDLKADKQDKTLTVKQIEELAEQALEDGKEIEGIIDEDILIKAEKVELPGLKVVGKIELPEKPALKESDEETDESTEVQSEKSDLSPVKNTPHIGLAFEQIPGQKEKRPKRNYQNKKRHNKRNKKKRELTPAQIKAKEDKQKAKELLIKKKREKERKTAYYKENVQSKITPSKKSIKDKEKIHHKKITKQKAIDRSNMSAWQKFVHWWVSAD